MNRLLLASAIASLPFGLAQAATFTPSTQTSQADGIHGPVAVEVTFTNSAIKSVKVTKHNETQGIGSEAVKQLPKKIVDLQSTQIDTLSGATITSKAILAAVDNCIRAAGGDPKALLPVQVKKATAKKTYYTDMVVVGGGGSGMSASIRGRYNGLNVILVEKMPYIGGAAAISGGQVVAQGSNLQKRFGVKDDSVESMMKDFMANGHNLNDQEKLRLYAENVGQTIDWLHDDVGVKIIENDLPYLAEYSHRRAVEFEGGAKTMAQHLREVISKNGTRVFFNTRVNTLVTDLDGRVIGVKATANDGTEVTIRAKATLLTTGGFGNNKQMLQEPIRSTLYYGPVSSTGDGHQMAMNLGAATQLMAYGKRYPNGIEVAPGIAKSTIYANVGAFDQAGILVSVEGKRFVNEKASNRHILDPMLETPNGQGYVFMDQKSWEGFYKRLPETGVSHSDADKYLNDESNTPLFVKGATIEEVAAKAGIDAKNLAKTVERYNTFVRNGKDADFDRPVQYMKAEISAEGPYYIVEQKPRFATTMGGLKTDSHLNVIDTKGNVIPGLYAAGELVGGVMGDDSPAGANVGWALTSGRVAADEIKQALKK